MIQAKQIPLSKLVANTGQIEGLPKNPRTIRDEKFAKLVQSLKDDPEMLHLRELLVYPLEKKFVVIGGNMRLLALKELGHKDAPCKVLDKDTEPKKLRAYATKDNVGFGDWDWSELANEWDEQELSDWAVDIPIGQDFGGANQEINTDGFADEVSLVLKFSEADHAKVREALARVAATPEQAIWKLLDLE